MGGTFPIAVWAGGARTREARPGAGNERRRSCIQLGRIAGNIGRRLTVSPGFREWRLSQSTALEQRRPTGSCRSRGTESGAAQCHPSSPIVRSVPAPGSCELSSGSTAVPLAWCIWASSSASESALGLAPAGFDSAPGSEPDRGVSAVPGSAADRIWASSASSSDTGSGPGEDGAEGAAEAGSVDVCSWVADSTVSGPSACGEVAGSAASAGVVVGSAGVLDSAAMPWAGVGSAGETVCMTGAATSGVAGSVCPDGAAPAPLSASASGVVVGLGFSLPCGSRIGSRFDRSNVLTVARPHCPVRLLNMFDRGMHVAVFDRLGAAHIRGCGCGFGRLFAILHAGEDGGVVLSLDPPIGV